MTENASEVFPVMLPAPAYACHVRSYALVLVSGDTLLLRDSARTLKHSRELGRRQPGAGWAFSRILQI